MKNTITAAYVAFVLAGMGITAPFTVLRAEDSMGAPQQDPEGDDSQGAVEHFGLPRNLGLSPDQAGKLKGLMESQRSTMKPLRDQDRDLIKKIRDQVEAKASDEDIQATLNDMQALHKTMDDQAEHYREQLDALLTPTQRARLLLDRMNHMKHGPQAGRGHRREDQNRPSNSQNMPPPAPVQGDDAGNAAQ